jgi:hypothetical protein
MGLSLNDPSSTGVDGKSAFELWLEDGNEGTLADFWEFCKGEPGLDGLNGIDGQDGAQGIQGPPGLPGTPGADGAPGIQGLPGEDGVAGATGLQGVQGPPGQDGAQGIQGIPGVKGDKGDTGNTGGQGIQGIQGIPGTNGTNGTQGIQGIPGPAGQMTATYAGNVTQLTNKTTGVTNNALYGQITMAATALAAGTSVSHTLTNSQVVANDMVVIGYGGGPAASAGQYTFNAVAGSGTIAVTIRNNSSASRSDAVIYRFAILKGV